MVDPWWIRLFKKFYLHNPRSDIRYSPFWDSRMLKGVKSLDLDKCTYA